MMTKSYLCPSTAAYWAPRIVAFSLIRMIDRNLATLSLEEMEPYWVALQQAKSNTTVHEILHAQGRMALLPALGPIPEEPEVEVDAATKFGWEPTDDSAELSWRAFCEKQYLEDLADRREYDNSTDLTLTEDGIVCIVTASAGDEEGSFYRQKCYLNGKLHDVDGDPAVTERSRHHIPSEGYLDEDYTESYRHGEWVSRTDNDDAVIRGCSPCARPAFARRP